MNEVVSLPLPHAAKLRVPRLLGAVLLAPWSRSREATMLCETHQGAPWNQRVEGCCSLERLSNSCPNTGPRDIIHRQQ